jgi:alpha,alpha-trehalase
MILRVHAKLGDQTWLKSTTSAVDRYYAFWTREPHLTPSTGLSRYYDLGKGPSIEVLSGEKDQEGRTHYDRVKGWFMTHPVSDYDATRFYDRKRNVLTALYYVADRSMRESGYDPSNRFGPFNAGVIDYNPVCLNSLLYRMERDAAEIQRILGDTKAAARWTQRAETRARAIHRYLWDPQTSLFLDYDYDRRVRRVYPFGTAFFPLWVGVASRDQAAKLVDKALRELEVPGGLRTSTNQSGNQWDAPFGWAPLELVAAEGLRAYGYATEADRITANFLSLVLKEFADHRAIFEKYDVEQRRSEVSQGIKFGYSSNEIGFGWTNAAFVTLYDALPDGRRADVRRFGGVAVPPH